MLCEVVLYGTPAGDWQVVGFWVLWWCPSCGPAWCWLCSSVVKFAGKLLYVSPGLVTTPSASVWSPRVVTKWWLLAQVCYALWFPYTSTFIYGLVRNKPLMESSHFKCAFVFCWDSQENLLQKCCYLINTLPVSLTIACTSWRDVSYMLLIAVFIALSTFLLLVGVE